MRGRSGLATAAAIFVALLLVAALLGRLNRGVIDEDARASTYVRGPAGASGLWEALPALGVTVRRLRERPREVLADTGRVRAALVVLAPSAGISPPEQRALLYYNARVSGGGDLIVVGINAWRLMRCYGYEPRPLLLDSVRAFVPGQSAQGAAPIWSRMTLVPHEGDRDSSSMFIGATEPCTLVRIARVDTLLASSRGPVALRLEGQDSGRSAILVADAALFRNRRVRETAAGPFVLGLLARYQRVTFDEYHHGYGPSGSLARALFAWSARSPLGWVVWQAAVVGLLALLAAAIRFGPPRYVLQRRRRAPMEHVRALATTLAAARGHDVAIGILVQGLRRRLSPAGRGARGAAENDARWLQAMERRGVPRLARPALESLKKLMKPGQDEAAVLRAANDVEDVWDTLRQSAPATWRH